MPAQTYEPERWLTYFHAPRPCILWHSKDNSFVLKILQRNIGPPQYGGMVQLGIGKLYDGFPNFDFSKLSSPLALSCCWVGRWLRDIVESTRSYMVWESTLGTLGEAYTSRGRFFGQPNGVGKSNSGVSFRFGVSLLSAQGYGCKIDSNSERENGEACKKIKLKNNTSPASHGDFGNVDLCLGRLQCLRGKVHCCHNCCHRPYPLHRNGAHHLGRWQKGRKGSLFVLATIVKSNVYLRAVRKVFRFSGYLWRGWRIEWETIASSTRTFKERKGTCGNGWNGEMKWPFVAL